jgi:hypothetical protein
LKGWLAGETPLPVTPSYVSITGTLMVMPPR